MQLSSAAVPDYGGDWVPKIRVPKGNTRTRTKFWVWVGLGLCLNSMGIFGLGTHKVENFGVFWVLPLGTRILDPIWFSIVVDFALYFDQILFI